MKAVVSTWALAAAAMLTAPVARAAAATAPRERPTLANHAISVIAPDIPRHGSGAIAFGGHGHG